MKVSESGLARGASYVILGSVSILAAATTGIPPVTPPLRLLATALSMATVVLFVLIQRRVSASRPAPWWWASVAGVCAVGAQVLGNQWSVLGVAGAGIALLAGAGWLAWVTELCLVIAAMVDLWVGTPQVGADIAILLTSVLIGVVLYALARLTTLVQQLRLAQEEIARSRVDQERLRISRDLHDILGRTLVTASLRNQAAIQLMKAAPEKALAQLEATHETLASGQLALRSLTSGPVVASLSDEVESAVALCRKMGIEVVLDVVELPEREQARLCAQTVREAVTNMLKHARPTSCAITIRCEPSGVVASIVNDGVMGEPGPGAGTGLKELRRRVEMWGGDLESGPHAEGLFSVVLRLPTSSFDED